MTSTLKWPLGPRVKWPLPLMCPVLIFITPLHFSNAELLVYLITYKLRIRTLCHLPLASTWFFFFFLTYLRSVYLSCNAQLRRFLLSKAFFHYFAAKTVSLSSVLPPCFIYVLIITFFFLLSIIISLHIFSPSLDWVSWIGVLFIFVSQSLGIRLGT